MSEELMQTFTELPNQESANMQNTESENVERFLTFLSDGLTYAVSTNYVIEIITNPSITTLPMVPEFISGIMNLRGQIIPIMDIRVRMGRPAASQPSSYSCVIVLDFDSVSLGVLVDTVSQVLDVDKSRISPMPANNHQELVNGMISMPDEEVILFLDCNLLVNNT